jgi:hydroxymethylpyrimidine/phosphomethylpyrimidine kinase
MKTVLLLQLDRRAGIQQDLKVATLLGAYGMTVVTALTVQNTVGVREVHPVDPDLVAAQLEAIFTDIKIDAVKVGMLATAAITRVVAAARWQLSGGG